MEKMFELLMQDHREVSRMINQMQNMSGQKREKLLSQCTDVLEMHMQIEEDYLYPILEDIDETKDIIRDSYEEHKMVQKQLKELGKLDVDDQKWDTRLQAMKENFDHHAQQEETVLFKQTPKLLSREELDDLNYQIIEEKEAA
ncbi:MAG: hemerythrin domain-containing protein [Nitrospirota bacterium]